MPDQSLYTNKLPGPRWKKIRSQIELKKNTQMSSQHFILNTSCNWEICPEPKAVKMHQLGEVLEHVLDVKHPAPCWTQG